MIPSFLTITLDGQALGELSPDAILEAVEVRQELNQHWWCEIVCRQTEDRRFPIEDCLGMDLKVTAHDEENRRSVLFDGLVLRAELVYEVYGSYTARILGVTRSYKLDVTPQQAYFRKNTLPEVAQRLTGDDGLEAQVQCAARPPKNYVQWGETDFNFLRRLADDHDCWIRPTPTGVEIRDRFEPGTTLEWRGEDGLLEFRISGELGQPSFSGTHYNPRKMSSQTFTAVRQDPQFSGASRPMVEAVQRQSARRLPAGFVHWDTRAATPTEYEDMLKKESVRSIASRIVGSGVSRNQDLTPGNTVHITGPLDVAGDYGVTKVIHRWTGHGFENEFWCTPWKSWVEARQPRPQAIPGVVPARVVNHNDRRRMGRVQVRYPWQEDTETGWARMVTPHAGGDRGFMFQPEVGDEVLVAFEQGDPERPMVLGSLWNGVDGAPRQGFWDDAGVEEVTVKNPGTIQIPKDVARNEVKRIVTKSGHQIQFVDTKGQESLVLSTPGGQKIQLIDACPETGGRRILCLTSPGDIFLNAPDGRVHIRSKFFSRETG